MLRTLFTVGIVALLGLVALKLVFGLLGPLVSLLFWLVGLALRVLLLGAVVYFVVRLISPATAERIARALRP
jgi:ABC-type multidrug transport system permease subunit